MPELLKPHGEADSQGRPTGWARILGMFEVPGVPRDSQRLIFMYL